MRQLVIILMLAVSGTAFAEGKNAGVAMLLSVVPGGGQFYCERYVAGTLLGGGEVGLGYLAYRYHRENRLSERNSVLWWGFFLFGYTLADAYVSAKMFRFDADADIDGISFKISRRF